MSTTNQAEWTAVAIDEENGSDEWWTALRERYPRFARSLEKNEVAVIRSGLWAELAALPGFDGPDYAPTPLRDFGGEGEQWAYVVGSPHAVFETLE